MESAPTTGLLESSAPYGGLLDSDQVVPRVRRFKPAMNLITDGERQVLLGEAMKTIREGNLGAKDALRG